MFPYPYAYDIRGRSALLSAPPHGLPVDGHLSLPSLVHPYKQPSQTFHQVQSGETGLPDKNAEHFYTKSKVDTLIEDLTGAAHEAIEQAAVEATKAAALVSLEHEAVAIREAQRLQVENSHLKQSQIKTAVVTGLICFFGDLAAGTGDIAIVQGVQ